MIAIYEASEMFELISIKKNNLLQKKIRTKCNRTTSDKDVSSNFL